MPKPAIVTTARYTESLGMYTLILKDQDGAETQFHFAPAQFSDFSEMTAQVAQQPAWSLELIDSTSTPRPGQTAARKLADWARVSRSQSAGFAVLADPVENVAYLILRQSSGSEAGIPLDSEYLKKLISTLGDALAAIQAAQPGRH